MGLSLVGLPRLLILSNSRTNNWSVRTSPFADSSYTDHKSFIFFFFFPFLSFSFLLLSLSLFLSLSLCLCLSICLSVSLSVSLNSRLLTNPGPGKSLSVGSHTHHFHIYRLSCKLTQFPTAYESFTFRRQKHRGPTNFSLLISIAGPV